ncbi:MAG: LAGLIDADG family homing endonuclease [Promethearchaeota archaeon]
MTNKKILKESKKTYSCFVGPKFFNDQNNRHLLNHCNEIIVVNTNISRPSIHYSKNLPIFNQKNSINNSRINLAIKAENIDHYNRWLTDRIQIYLKNLSPKIKYLFAPFIPFSKMNKLFGFGKDYITTKRDKKFAKQILAKSILVKMRLNLKKHITEWIEDFSHLEPLLIQAQSDIIGFIDEYEDVLKPKPSPSYQMYKFHPNFNRNYFSLIDSKEKAYWLGFLFADGYISIEHKKSGDFYRMGIGIHEKDKSLLIKFCRDIGLNPDYITTRLVRCSYTGTRSPISEIRWGGQKFANDLINLGIKYTYDVEKGRRVKIMEFPTLKNHKLMLAFLLGFYDGDGSLGYSSKDETIYPTIISTNKEFLLRIRTNFNISYDIAEQTNERYNMETEEIEIYTIFRLYLGNELFLEMMQNYQDSLKRKRVSIEWLKKYGRTPQRRWFKKNLSKETFQKILNVLSPTRIEEIIGIKRDTVKNIAKEVYGLKPKDMHEYMRISSSIRWKGKKSPYYEEFSHWTNYLENIGKFIGILTSHF